MALRVRPVRVTRSERDSGPPTCSSRTIALRFARRTVSLRCPSSSRPISTRFVFLSCQTCVRDSYNRRGHVKTEFVRSGVDGERPLRWGILSTADIATAKVIPGIRTADRCEIVAIASRDAERARGVGGEPGHPARARHLRGAARRPGRRRRVHPAARTTSTPSGRSPRPEAGKHVLCEKPLAMTAADAQRMVDAARAAGVLLMEAFMYRHHPSWVAVARAGRARPHRAAHGGPELVLVLQRRPRQHPQHPRRSVAARSSTSAATAVNLSRMLFDGRADTRRGRDRARSASWASTSRPARSSDFDGGIATFTCSTRTETDQRVDIYGTDGQHLDRDPVQHPARSSDQDLRHGRRRPAGRPGDRGARRSRRPIRTASQAERSRPRSSMARRHPSRPRTPSPTCG